MYSINKMISQKKGGFRRFGVQFPSPIFSVCSVYHEENDTRGKPVINVPPPQKKTLPLASKLGKVQVRGKYKYRYNEEGRVEK